MEVKIVIQSTLNQAGKQVKTYAVWIDGIPKYTFDSYKTYNQYILSLGKVHIKYVGRK